MTTWHEYIQKIEANAIFEVWGTHDAESVVEGYHRLMQERYPGPYVLTYAREQGRIEIHPYFQDPEEELMWKLRFG